MKKLTSIFLSIVLITLVACSTGTDTAKVEIIPEGTELSGVLEIYTDSQFYDLEIDGFKELHPNVDVIINDGIDYQIGFDEVLEFEKFKSDLGVKILGGSPPDLILSGDDYVTNYVPSGLIVDLYEYMDADPTFNEEDYFMNALEAYELKGGLYSMPSELTITMLRLNKNVLEAAGVDHEEIEFVDYSLIYDTYNKAIESGKIPWFEYITESGKSLFNDEEFSLCFDRDTMTANFETEALKKYLETTKSYDAPDNQIINDFEGFEFSELIDIEDDSTVENYPYMGLSKAFTVILSDPIKMVQEYDNLTKALPVVNSESELFLDYTPQMSITKGAKNPELAWEFIKFCVYEAETLDLSIPKIGRFDGDKFTGVVSINRNNTEKYFDIMLTNSRFTQEEEDEYMSLLLSTLELPMTKGISSVELLEALYYIQEDYYSGLLTVDECVSAMQERAEIYLSEIE